MKRYIKAAYSTQAYLDTLMSNVERDLSDYVSIIDWWSADDNNLKVRVQFSDGSTDTFTIELWRLSMSEYYIVSDSEIVEKVINSRAADLGIIDDESEESDWERLRSKSVKDSDGFMTDYTLYYNPYENLYVCIFGDSEIYTPENSDPDFECETAKEAEEWFDSYTGFDEDEVISSSDIHATYDKYGQYYTDLVELESPAVDAVVNSDIDNVDLKTLSDAVDEFCKDYDKIPNNMEGLDIKYDMDKGRIYKKYRPLFDFCKELKKKLHPTGYGKLDFLDVKKLDLCKIMDYNFPHGWKSNASNVTSSTSVSSHFDPIEDMDATDTIGKLNPGDKFKNRNGVVITILEPTKDGKIQYQVGDDVRLSSEKSAQLMLYRNNYIRCSFIKRPIKAAYSIGQKIKYYTDDKNQKTAEGKILSISKSTGVKGLKRNPGKSMVYEIKDTKGKTYMVDESKIVDESTQN